MSIEIVKAAISPIIIILLTAVISRLVIHLFLNLLAEAGCKRSNFKGKGIIFGVGMSFIPILLIMSIFCIFFYPANYMLYAGYILGISIIGFAGVIDDLLGERHIKGLRNHMNNFLHGHMTTGFLKAFLGLLASTIISIIFSKGIIDLLINILNIALFTNTLNLLDLRPGRCSKIFIFIGSILLLFNIKHIISYLPLGIAIIMVSIYLYHDLREQCMLGDSGSNILGLTLGYFASLGNTFEIKLGTLLILLTINLAAEKVSLSKIISKNKFLNYLDSIGRSS